MIQDPEVSTRYHKVNEIDVPVNHVNYVAYSVKSSFDEFEIIQIDAEPRYQGTLEGIGQSRTYNVILFPSIPYPQVKVLEQDQGFVEQYGSSEAVYRLSKKARFRYHFNENILSQLNDSFYNNKDNSILFQKSKDGSTIRKYNFLSEVVQFRYQWIGTGCNVLDESILFSNCKCESPKEVSHHVGIKRTSFIEQICYYDYHYDLKKVEKSENIMNIYLNGEVHITDRIHSISPEGKVSTLLNGWAVNGSNNTRYLMRDSVFNYFTLPDPIVDCSLIDQGVSCSIVYSDINDLNNKLGVYYAMNESLSLYEKDSEKFIKKNQEVLEQCEQSIEDCKQDLQSCKDYLRDCQKRKVGRYLNIQVDCDGSSCNCDKNFIDFDELQKSYSIQTSCTWNAQGRCSISDLVKD